MTACTATVDLATKANEYCDDQNVAAVDISRPEEIIRVTSSLLGGGATYYRNSDELLQCPVVGPDSMSAECRAMMEISDWESVCVTDPAGRPSDEEAETTAFNFILDFIAVAPPEPDQAAADRIMAVLSVNALEKIDRETLSRDVAQFVGVQDVPDQGASVEDLQIVSDTEAYLVVGLNYSGGRTERNVHMVVENGVWKVDRVSIAEDANGDASSPPALGGDRDEHGCIGSAGYSWCAPKNKCLRIWEEPCYVHLEQEIQYLFAEKYDRPAHEVRVTISKQTANHAGGGVKFGIDDQGAGGLFLAAKIDNVWQLVYDGNGSIDCVSLRQEYGFPDEILQPNFCDE